ncbi:CdaR family protein [Paenibacillus sp. HW567]|uniref:CdaR family protein n=1 Tax=Paenibacillus sp. HW567 TaxID=1034769 RepID=UPI000361B5BE|nr:CdaR family protein [Paenibacillus sp. HW567]
MDKWMKNNNFNKILALALAIILWTIVHVDTAPTSQTTVNTESKTIENIKIDVKGFDEEKYVMSMDAESVRLEVRGKKSDLTFKFSDAYKVWVDLSNVQPGDTTIPLHYSLPSGVILEGTGITPNEVNVHVELRNTKAFPISVITKGEAAAGYLVGTPVVQPAGTAEVTMADSELSKVAKVQAVIQLNGESDSITENKLKLYAYDSSGNEIKDAVIEPSSVSVELPITLPSKILPLDISFTGQLPGSLALSGVTPEQDTVTVYGTEATLASLSSYEATLDLSTIDSAGTKQMKLELTTPKGTQKIEPGAVNVSVVTSEIAEKTIDSIPIKLEGVDKGLTAQITGPAGKAVTLTVSGAPNLLNQLNRDNISVVADVVGLGAGSHEVVLHVSLPRFISMSNASQRLTATVELLAEATPAVSGAIDKGGSVIAPTPEPSAEPASGQGSVTVPTQSSENTATTTPAPTDIPAENNGTTDVNGTGDSANGTGGT